ncbi:MAG: WbqC family protein [Bacteroidaceae bacterium]
MKLSSHQSVFLPWSGFWHKAATSDLMVINSGSDFSRQDCEHRVKINNSWLTLELDRQASGKKISDIVLQQGTLTAAADRIERELCIKKNRYRDRLEPILLLLRNSEGNSLEWVNSSLVLEVAATLHIATSFVFINEVPHGTSKTDKLYNRVGRFMRSDDTYISGAGAAAYIDHIKFPNAVEMQFIDASLAEPNSMIELIAKHKDPMDYISSWFTYLKMDECHVEE